MDTKLWNPKNR